MRCVSPDMLLPSTTSKSATASISSAAGRLARIEPRRDRHADRRERRGQDDAAPHDQRPAPANRAARSWFSEQTDNPRAGSAARDRAARHLPRPRGPAGLPEPDDARKPAARRIPAEANARASAATSTRATPVPRPRRAPRAEGRHALRRRAADARDRPRTDGSGRSCCCWTSRRWAWRR